MRTSTRQPVVVGIRELVLALRREAGRVWADPRTQRLMAEIAARDLISRGDVTVGGTRRRGAPSRSLVPSA
jgi:hypothetical protein